MNAPASPEHPVGEAVSGNLSHLITAVGVRLFVPDEPTPCQQYTPQTEGPDDWFADQGDLARMHAIARCRTCPFMGRCGFNAVACGATDGVWGGVQLPGTGPRKAPLHRAYDRLIAQFEQRRRVELGDAIVPALPRRAS